jgi:hypothetical protein
MLTWKHRPSPEYQLHDHDGSKDWRRQREIGVWNQLRLYDGVEGFMLRLLTVAGGVRLLPSYRMHRNNVSAVVF